MITISDTHTHTHTLGFLWRMAAVKSMCRYCDRSSGMRLKSSFPLLC